MEKHSFKHNNLHSEAPMRTIAVNYLQVQKRQLILYQHIYPNPAPGIAMLFKGDLLCFFDFYDL